MQRFLELVNFFGDSIINWATKAKQLTERTKSSKTFEWTQDAQEALDCLKEERSSEPVLAITDEEGMFHLNTDASEVAIAGIFHQEHEWNGRKVLCLIWY